MKKRVKRADEATLVQSQKSMKAELVKLATENASAAAEDIMKANVSIQATVVREVGAMSAKLQCQSIEDREAILNYMMTKVMPQIIEDVKADQGLTPEELQKFDELTAEVRVWGGICDPTAKRHEQPRTAASEANPN